MRSANLLATACLLLAALPAAQPVPRPAEPFVRVGVSYPAGLSRDRERAAADLEAINTLGFNSIRVPIDWADAEPARGQYRLEALDQTLELAGQRGPEGRAAARHGVHAGVAASSLPGRQVCVGVQGGGPAARARVSRSSRCARGCRGLRRCRKPPRRAARCLAGDRRRQRAREWLLRLSPHRASLSRVAEGDVRLRRRDLARSPQPIERRSSRSSGGTISPSSPLPRRLAVFVP